MADPVRKSGTTCGPLGIVTRNEWGAMPPRPAIEAQGYERVMGIGAPADEYISNAVVHHSGWQPNDTPLFVQKKAFLMGYDDIPYHFYIGGDGTIFEGRDLKYVGAHAGITVEAEQSGNLHLDPDYGSIGIALAGCFDDTCVERHGVTKAQDAALESLLGFLMCAFPRITPERVFAHKDVDRLVVEAQGLTPTRNTETLCPGDAALTLGDILKRLGARAAAGIALGLGFEYRRVEDGENGVAFHSVRIDPARASAGVAAGEKPFEDHWKSSGRAGVMINANFFDEEHRPLGLLISEGRIISKPVAGTGPFSGLFGITKDGRWELTYLKDAEGRTVAPGDLSRFVLAIQAGPMVIEPGGKDGIPPPKPRAPNPPMPRTIIMKTKTNEWYLLVTEPVDFYSLQQAIRRFAPDADAALAFDGGPSSGMILGNGAKSVTLATPSTPIPAALVVKPKNPSKEGSSQK